jgi:hypothetical protein
MPPVPSTVAGVLEPATRPQSAEAAPAAQARAAESSSAEEEALDAIGAIDNVFTGELLALIEDVFAPEPTRLAVAGEAATAPAALMATPLFEEFSTEELLEVIRGLRLRHFTPGEILVTEGEPGGSLFVLTLGAVRAYVKNARGQHVFVRALGEGDFFGEISLLKGTPRTATITAAERCELLEIERSNFDSISQRHPHVWVVLKEFYDKRAGSTLEVAARDAAQRASG